MCSRSCWRCRAAGVRLDGCDGRALSVSFARAASGTPRECASSSEGAIYRRTVSSPSLFAAYCVSARTPSISISPSMFGRRGFAWRRSTSRRAPVFASVVRVLIAVLPVSPSGHLALFPGVKRAVGAPAKPITLGAEPFVEERKLRAGGQGACGQR